MYSAYLKMILPLAYVIPKYVGLSYFLIKT